MEILDARAASFVSVTQQFSTTTSMGRLTLNVLLSFAQFEREVIGERIRDKIAASKRKGMWMGGVPPLGYRAEGRKLVVIDSEAEIVRLIFRRRRLPLPIDADMQPAVLALNNAHAIELSWLDPERLQSLLAQAFYARRIGELDAFLLALDQTVAYDSPNYLWFRQRYPRFMYVDRVVVRPAKRGRGYGRLLYADLFCHARQAGHNFVVCEINSSPPNPASEALHAALKFADVGKARIHRGAKTVRYLARAIGLVTEATSE